MAYDDDPRPADSGVLGLDAPGDAPVAEAPLDEPAPAPAPAPVPAHDPAAGNMVPARERRRSGIERVFVRLVATGGIVGIAVALGAILASSNVAGWTIGLVIGLTSVILAAVLWSSRQL